MTGIYKITNPKGKVYIGQAKDLEKREQDYKYQKGKGQPLLYNSIKKYGWDEHTFKVIELCEWDQLNIRERYWQEHYNVLEEGLNCMLVCTDVLPMKRAKNIVEKVACKNRTGVKTECCVCGQEIYRQKHEVRKSVTKKFTCSSFCNGIARRKKETRVCKYCGTFYKDYPSSVMRSCGSKECIHIVRSEASTRPNPRKK